MPAGFQSVNDDSVLQIDSMYQNVSLLRKGTITTVREPSSDNPPAIADVTVYAGEILALSSSIDFCVYWISGNTYTIGTSDEGDVDYYIFGESSSTSNFGMQVFDASTGLVFDSSWKPMRIAGVTSGEGNFAYSSSRTYAVISIAQHWRSRREAYQEPQDPSFYTKILETFTDMVAINNGTISVSEDTVYSYFRIVQDPGQSWTGVTTNTNDLTTSLLIADVTGY